MKGLNVGTVVDIERTAYGVAIVTSACSSRSG